MKNNLKTAFYMRISQKEKKLISNESNSISNQRNILKNYFKKNLHNNTEILEFIDDGYSGRIFNRPAFELLIDKVKNNLIDCILVKDLSRFGRNFFEVSNYLEYIFPFAGIRFISVNDNYDSNKIDVELNVILKNYMNEFYSRDLSQKILSSRKIKYKKGEYMAAAPYGYKRIFKNKLEIDEEAATVVKKIFDMALKGFSCAEISKVLNSENILTPRDYKNMKNNKSKVLKKSWQAYNVYALLKNPHYTGLVINNKTSAVDIGSRQHIKNPKENWVISENMHIPIISEKDFKDVNNLLKNKKPNLNTNRIVIKKQVEITDVTIKNEKIIENKLNKINIKKQELFEKYNFNNISKDIYISQMKILLKEEEELV